MNAAGPIRQSGMFVDGGNGRRFRLLSRPAGTPELGTVVFLHAFAEEMNKSRRMAARTARALAARGWTVVQRDLFGCGDSAGEFADATWQDWADDVADEVARTEPARPLWLWCHRGGALLAAPALRARPDVNLLLWQPALSGAQHLQQFLRLHAGARIVGSGKATDGPSPLQRLRAGETVELGGYELSPALALGMEQARLELPDGFAGRVLWLELNALEPAELPLPVSQCVARWRERGIDVRAQALSGPAFWQTQEIEDCDLLLRRTIELMDEARPGGAIRSSTDREAAA